MNLIDKYTHCPICNKQFSKVEFTHSTAHSFDEYECIESFCEDDKQHKSTIKFLINNTTQIQFATFKIGAYVIVCSILPDKSHTAINYKNITCISEKYDDVNNGLNLIDFFMSNINDEEKIKDKINTILI